MNQECKRHLVNARRLKVRFDPELKHALDYTAQVMAEDFTKGFIYLRGVALAANVTAELRFDHAKSGLNIRAFVVSG